MTRAPEPEDDREPLSWLLVRIRAACRDCEALARDIEERIALWRRLEREVAERLSREQERRR